MLHVSITPHSTLSPVEGTFDDCQKLVKDTFADLAFKRKHNLAAINSINWARILAQTVYYFYSYFQVLGSATLDQCGSV